MLLKVLVVILFVAVVASLSSSLLFLVKDIEHEAKRTMYALGIRISLAVALLGCIAYGLHTGEFGSRAPWDRQATSGVVIDVPSATDVK